MHFVRGLFEKYERRDVAEILPAKLPDPIDYRSQREFVRRTLEKEVTLSTRGTDFVPRTQESDATREYRNRMNQKGSPSDIISAGYKWRPGTMLAAKD